MTISAPRTKQRRQAPGWFARLMFKGRKTKHWMRTFYGLRGIWALKRGLMTESDGANEYWQAGKSVAGIHAIEPAGAEAAPLESSSRTRTGRGPCGRAFRSAPLRHLGRSASRA